MSDHFQLIRSGDREPTSVGFLLSVANSACINLYIGIRYLHQQ